MTIPCAPTNVDSRSHEHQRAEEQYWKLQLRWQRIGAIATIAAFVAAAIYVCYEKQQVAQAIAANKNANSWLHVTERAYITTDGPVLDPGTKFATLHLNNDGHLPCPDSETTAHEATVNMSIANAAPNIKEAVEFHWKSTRGQIPPGQNHVTLAIPVTAFSEAKFGPQGAYQAIFIAGRIKYEDGFPDDPLQKWSFCFQSVYHLTLKQLFWVSCDPSLILPQMEKLDGYPNNEQNN